MNIIKNDQNRYSCAVCGKEFNSYNTAYVHLRRIHTTHPSVRAERERYTEENIPSASLFGRTNAVRREPEYDEYIHREPEYYERERRDYRDDKREEKGSGAALVLFIIGMVAVGIWIYFRYFRGKFDFWGLLSSNEQNDSNGEEPVHWIDNSAPVTRDGAWPVFHVKGEA